MKKKLIIILGSVGGVFLLFFILFMVFFIQIHDSKNNTPKEIIKNNFEAQQVLSREMTEALSYSDSMNLELSEYEVNEILYPILMKIEVSNIKIKGCYVEYQDGYYCIEVPCTVYGVKSNLRLTTSLVFDKTNGLVLKVCDIELGSKTIDSFLLSKIVLSNKNKAKMISSLEEKGIYIQIQNKLDIQMTEEDIIKTLTCKESSLSGLYKLLTKLAFHEDFFSVNIHDGIIAANLAYDEIESKNMSTIDYRLDYDIPCTKTLNLLNAGVNYTNIGSVFSYYTLGYDDLSENAKKDCDDLGLSRYEEGIKEDSLTLAGVLLASNTTLGLGKGITFSLDEHKLNQIFASLSFVGAGTCFTDGSTLAYISLEAIDFELYNQELMVTVVVNLNGHTIAISSKAEALDSKSLSLEGSIQNIGIGQKELESFYTPYVLEYLGEVTSSLDWMSTNETSIFLDFENQIRNTGLLTKAIFDITKRRVEVRDNEIDITLSVL